MPSSRDVMVKPIPYPLIRPLDRVVCGGGKVTPTAMLIRRVTAGRRFTFDVRIAVHTGLVVDAHGQKFVAEMLADGLSIDSLERYLEKRRRFILGFRRSSVFDDPQVREDAQKRIWYDYRKGIDYDWKGDLEFVFKRVKDSKQRYYCSEYDWFITKEHGCQYPAQFEKAVSPRDLQICQGWSDLSIP